MKTEKIYGETFEVYKVKDIKEFFPDFRYHYLDIYSAYDKPSEIKCAIWDYWKNFGLFSNEKSKYWIGIPVITSRNCFMFTITFNVYDIETNEFVGIAKITKEHNKLYLKED